VLKICGITRAVDARHAVDQGATALGFVFWAESPRCVTPAQAADLIADMPEGVAAVGVFVNEPLDTISRTVEEAGLTAVQLHGDEPPAYAEVLSETVPVLRSVTLATVDRVRASWPPDTTLLLDAADPERRGGTGVTVDWTRAWHVARLGPIVLAGGLTPLNVAEAIATVRPWGVDVSSGVETAPGVKDPEKVSRFLAIARHALMERGEQGVGSR
jgi:phosphoribosylanthranilate isomerase